MPQSLLPIVEGHSEVESVPLLIRRIDPQISVARPFRIKRNKIVKAGELSRAIKQALRDRENVGAVLVLIDADEDAPATLQEVLLKESGEATTLACEIAVAQREFEAWLLGGKEALRGQRGIRPDATAPPEPEALPNPKSELQDNMTPGNYYLETDDQPAFSATFDIQAALTSCPSFRRFHDSVVKLKESL